MTTPDRKIEQEDRDRLTEEAFEIAGENGWPGAGIHNSVIKIAVELAERECLRSYELREELDPFGGRATTGSVARKLGRNFVIFELNPKYVALAEKYLHDELGMFK